MGGLCGGGEGMEADTGPDKFAADTLFKDGTEKDEIGAGVAGGEDVFDGVGADAEDGVGAIGLGKDRSCFRKSGGQGKRGGSGWVRGAPFAGKMEAVGTGLYGKRGRGVQEKAGPGAGREHGAELSGEGKEIGEGEILFAELEEVDTV